MQLIISEKAIAGKRIAEILSSNSFTTSYDAKAPFFEFLFNKQKTILIPLRGHILDVDFPKEFTSWTKIDVKELINVKILYNEKEKNIISLLKKFGKEADSVIIATDADREGEAIGLEALRMIQTGNPKIEVLRAFFSAITEEEINEAFSNLSKLDFSLADSADARREIDLIWGAVLTRFLSLSSGRFGKDFLSAGRVQSPVLALIVDREKERMKFKKEKYFEVEALLEKDKVNFKAFHEKGRISDKKEAERIASLKAKEAVVKSVKKTIKTLPKPVPFNTTDFLRAATAIGFSASVAMNTAETLYQKGLTSYPRTDNQVYPQSLNLKNILIKLSNGSFKEKISELLKQKTLMPSAGKKTKDHPPIYPVDIPKVALTEQEKRIYDLIVSRFLATLANDAKAESVNVVLLIESEKFIARGLTYIDLGWKKYYPYSKTEESVLPSLKDGDKANVKKIDLLEKETKPPARFSQGSLIQLMAKNNLGTKATRHEIISKLFFRKYIVGTKSIEPTKVAFAVVDGLENVDCPLVKSEMTAELETEMDSIAVGKKEKNEVVDDSREILSKIMAELSNNKLQIGNTIRTALKDDKVISSCTKEGCSGNLIIRQSRFKKRFLGCTEYPDCTNTFPLPQKGSIFATDKRCSVCTYPVFKLVFKKPFKTCINFDCSTKDEFKKKLELKALKPKKSYAKTNN